MGEIKLKDKQKKFAQEYIVDLNATQAAIRAGYSENTAAIIGYENLRKPNIEQYIQQLMNERSKKTEITAENVLRELAKLAFNNIKDLYREDGTLKPMNEISYDQAACIQEIYHDTIGDEDGMVIKRKYKTADKKSSLELLGKHLKLFTDKHEHSVDTENPLKWEVTYHNADHNDKVGEND